MLLIKLWFYTVTLFVAMMHARKVMQTEGLSLFWKINLWPMGVLAYLCDVAFNAVFGTLMYCEVPRELLFTSRCKRHKRESTGWRKQLAEFWCGWLNEFDPGHC